MVALIFSKIIRPHTTLMHSISLYILYIVLLIDQECICDIPYPMEGNNAAIVSLSPPEYWFILIVFDLNPLYILSTESISYFVKVVSSWYLSTSNAFFSYSFSNYCLILSNFWVFPSLSSFISWSFLYLSNSIFFCLSIFFNSN